MGAKTTPVKAAAAKVAPAVTEALSASNVLLDGRPYPIRPLKVGALKRAMIGVSEMKDIEQTAENAARLFDLMTEAVGLATGKPAAEIEELVDQLELQTAFGHVLQFSGAKEADPGEASRQGR